MESITEMLKEIRPSLIVTEAKAEQQADPGPAPLPAEQPPDPSPSQPEPTTPSPRAMEWGCTDCARYHDQFCWHEHNQTWRNIESLNGCPGREPRDLGNRPDERDAYGKFFEETLEYLEGRYPDGLAEYIRVRHPDLWSLRDDAYRRINLHWGTDYQRFAKAFEEWRSLTEEMLSLFTAEYGPVDEQTDQHPEYLWRQLPLSDVLDAFGCGGCDSYTNGWCTAHKDNALTAVNFLRRCPNRLSKNRS